jgi:regulator of sigma E protease
MTIIVAILLFGVIVFIHELGHFLFAKKAGIQIHEFAIGMGPKIFGTNKGGTEYSVRLLPLGGFVSMEGEDGESSSPNSFGKKSIGQRASVLFAGPCFNIILTMILLIPVYLYMGSPTTTLSTVEENGAAWNAGIRAGDEIKKVNGIEVNSWSDITTAITNSNGEPITLTIKRDNEVKEYNVTPELKDERYQLGIGTKMKHGIFNSIISAVVGTFSMAKEMLMFLWQLITGTVPGGAADAVAGPIGVIGIVSDAAKAGLINVIYIGAVISLNLGIFNLLPIPALDGGRIAMLGVEGLRGGKKLNPEKEGTIHMIGFALLMLLMLFVTYKDILRLF